MDPYVASKQLPFNIVVTIQRIWDTTQACQGSPPAYNDFVATYIDPLTSRLCYY